LTILKETPLRIAALTESLSPEQLHRRPGSNEWSVNEVLAHLRACADVWGDCMMRIITEDTPSFRGISPRTWIRKTDYPELEFNVSFPTFVAQRAKLLATLEPLPPLGWSRKAMVKKDGKVRERTVLHYADMMAHH